MARMPLTTYIKAMQNRGYKRADIWRLIKRNSNYRSIRNDFIAAAFTRVAREKKFVDDFNRMRPNAKIPLSNVPGNNRNPTSFQLGIEFTFTTEDRPGGTKGPSALRYLICDIPVGATKAEVLEKAKDCVRNWVAEHYEGRNIRGTANTIKIVDMKGI